MKNPILLAIWNFWEKRLTCRVLVIRPHLVPFSSKLNLKYRDPWKTWPHLFALEIQTEHPLCHIDPLK